MSGSYSSPDFEALSAEQREVQASQFQGRQLIEYDQYLFPKPPYFNHTAVEIGTFFPSLTTEPDNTSLETVLESIHAREQRQLHWADMGGGRGLAMREMACARAIGSVVTMTNVDLFDYGLEGISATEEDYLDTISPLLRSPESKPNVVIADVETVDLPTSADVITSIESVQYLDNPLKAIANWYNQLAGGGMMFVATASDWTYRMDWKRNEQGRPTRAETPTPIKRFLMQLAMGGVNYATSLDLYPARPQEEDDLFKTLYIEKKAGTAMIYNNQISSRTISTWMQGYKDVDYDIPTANQSPIVELVTV